MNQYSLRTPFCCLLHIVQFRLNMNDAQTHGLNAKSPREKKHCRITQGPLVWSLTCHQLGFALSIVVTVTPFYYRGPGTSGSPRTGGDLGWKMASAGIHPLALLSDGGATLFITHTHSHTHTHTRTHARTHTLGLCECRRPEAQTFPTANSVSALNVKTMRVPVASVKEMFNF